MAIFGIIADAQAAKREILRTITQPLKDVSRRLRTIRLLVWVVRAWAAVLRALNAILTALRAVLRFIGLLPFAPVRAFVRVLNTALSRLLDVISPISRTLTSFAQRLTALDNGLDDARDTISKIITRLRLARAKLLLVETLARALEPQQDLLERILPQSLLDRIRRAVARLEDLSRQLTMARMALIALFAPLDMLLSALKSISDEIEKLFGVLRAILASLNPLRGALNAIRDAIRQLLQNPIVRAVLDGITFFLSAVEALFDAVLEASGINRALDAILRRVAAVQGIITALEDYRRRLRELIEQLNAIRAQLNAILAILDEIIAVVDEIIAALQGIQLPVKTLIEASLTDYSDLIEHRDAPDFAETFAVTWKKSPRTGRWRRKSRI